MRIGVPPRLGAAIDPRHTHGDQEHQGLSPNLVSAVAYMMQGEGGHRAGDGTGSGTSSGREGTHEGIHVYAEQHAPEAKGEAASGTSFAAPGSHGFISDEHDRAGTAQAHDSIPNPSGQNPGHGGAHLPRPPPYSRCLTEVR